MWQSEQKASDRVAEGREMRFCFDQKFHNSLYAEKADFGPEAAAGSVSNKGRARALKTALEIEPMDASSTH